MLRYNNQRVSSDVLQPVVELRRGFWAKIIVFGVISVWAIVRALCMD